MRFPAANNRWFRIDGTVGYCGYDDCCEWQIRNQCTPEINLPFWFPLDGYNSCDELEDPQQFGHNAIFMMKGQITDAGKKICILAKDENGGEPKWVTKTIKMKACGGDHSCCAFSPED